jgi:hypothetical protein
MAFISPIDANPCHHFLLVQLFLSFFDPSPEKCIPYSRVLEGQHLSMHPLSGFGPGSNVYG